jgi:release factor glutamine methyltransferase
LSKNPNYLSIANAVREGCRQLTAGEVTEPRREAGSLLAHVLNSDRSFLIAHAEDPLTDGQRETFLSLIERRAAGEPLQYLTGHQEFFKLDFEVTPDVLIPRPETELIVEIAWELLREEPRPKMMEVGAGSGCITISVLHELPAALALATDLSPAALMVTRRNAARHGVADRLSLLVSDCFRAVSPEQSIDLIVSNPPYIPDDELKDLQREVNREPRAALAGGPDGLAIIRRLVREAATFLKSGGHFVFEIGFGQREAVKLLIDEQVWKLIEVRTDLQKIPRTFVLEKI